MRTQWNPYHIRLLSTHILHHPVCAIVRLSKDCLLSWAQLGAVRTKFCCRVEKQFYFEHGEHSYCRAEWGDIHFRSTILKSMFICLSWFQTHPLNDDLNIFLKFLNNIFNFLQISFNGVCHFQTIWQSKLSQLGTFRAILLNTCNSITVIVQNQNAYVDFTAECQRGRAVWIAAIQLRPFS